jgi:hypothetical protein
MPDVYDDNGQLVKQQVYGDDGRPVLATSASDTGPYFKPGELHRKDTSMFDINYEPTYNKISDWASHLPRGLQSIGAYPLSLSVSAMQGVTDALSQPETPAMMLGGWLKGALSPTKELAEIPKPIPKQLGPATTNLESTIGIPTGELKGAKYELPISSTFDKSPVLKRFEVSKSPEGVVSSKPIYEEAADATNTGTGQPTEQLQPNSRLPFGEMAYNDDGELIHPPSLDSINAQPRAATPNNLSHIPGGQADVPPTIASPPDIIPFRAESSTPHIVMDNFPQTKPAIEAIYKAQDEGSRWEATTNRELEENSAGLNKNERKQLMHLMNGDEVPDASPEVRQAAIRGKQITDSIYDMADDKSPENIGFIDRYIPHIEKQPDDVKSAVAEIWNHQFGKDSGWNAVFGKENLEKSAVNDLYEKGLGSPTSNFIKHRSDMIIPEEDYNKIMPVYTASMKKVIFDRPATDIAKDTYKSLPDGALKEWMGGYIKNYTKYDADANLSTAWGRLANNIATTNARSIIPFNPYPHLYHLGQIPASIYPELGEKYSMLGAYRMLSSPIQTYQELAKNGLFSNMIRPWSFQRGMQKFDSIGYYMNMVESLVKGIGYHGFKQRALDQGLSESDAIMRAIGETKNATQTVDPARNMRFYTPESDWIGGQGGRLLKQYHQIPTKIVEQFAHAMADWKEHPATAARYVAGSSLAATLGAAGLHTFHVNPLTLLSSYFGGAGQFGEMATGVIKKLAKGDLPGALSDYAAWQIPAGGVIKKGIKFVSGQ